MSFLMLSRIHLPLINPVWSSITYPTIILLSCSAIILVCSSCLMIWGDRPHPYLSSKPTLILPPSMYQEFHRITHNIQITLSNMELPILYNICKILLLTCLNPVPCLVLNLKLLNFNFCRDIGFSKPNTHSFCILGMAMPSKNSSILGGIRTCV